MSGGCCGVADTGFVSVGAVVQQVGEVLGRAHSLFGDPPASGQGPASGSVLKLSGAGELVRSGQAQMAPLSGQLATNYSTFAGGAGPALDTLAGTDRALSTQLDEAARSDRTGRTSSGGVVNGAAADTNGLAPFTNTPAGQKALLVALRNRVAQQQQVVQAYKTRSARMAALMRSMRYAGGSPVGGGTPFGGGGMGMPMGSSRGGGFPNFNIPQLARAANLSGQLNSGRRPLADRYAGMRVRPSDIPATPGAATIGAAINRALDIKGITNPRARRNWETGMMVVSARESGHNPNATNNWDSNAAKGTPSQGAFQFIEPTFRAYHEPGTSPFLRNPVAQATAFVNYAMGRYGVSADGSDLAARIQQADPTRPPKGY
ncbi:lytic transglycosylase [Mycolicibacterium tusciae]|uniref:lytic transglycosylase n=1 Tax=Mycolicibacterium tusciae TaxID=75922 RepID=UPI0004832E9A|nr:lytic transglycosylase [Mycolicibacterium tusciae]